jgi:hypothetical protein
MEKETLKTGVRVVGERDRRLCCYRPVNSETATSSRVLMKVVKRVLLHSKPPSVLLCARTKHSASFTIVISNEVRAVKGIDMKRNTLNLQDRKFLELGC